MFDDLIDRAIKGEVVNLDTKPTFPTRIGKGKKYCPCGEIIGARSLECPHCHHQFKVGELFHPPEPKSLEQLELESYCRGLAIGGKVIYTPSGECPVPLLDKSEEGIYTWCEEVVDCGHSDRKIYTPTALSYWLGTIVGVNTEEFVQLNRFVKQWASDIIKAFS